jgi:hypothetical protein
MAWKIFSLQLLCTRTVASGYVTHAPSLAGGLGVQKCNSLYLSVSCCGLMSEHPTVLITKFYHPIVCGIDGC